MTNQKKIPVIGISSTLLTIESGCFLGLERMAVLSDYIEAIRLTGGVPMILPIVEEDLLIERQMSLVDALLLTGGYDVSPFFYDEEPQRGLETVRPERDIYELKLIEFAKKSGKPILGICRGLQILNVALGGTLYQDIGAALPSALQHSQKAKPDEETHTVKIISNTRLHQIFKEEFILTNSFHHQSIKEIASGAVANAHSMDGVIEGIEVAGDSFILGVQWHPELMISKCPQMFKLFHSFIEAAKRRGV